MLASAAIAAPAFGRTISGIPWVPGLADRPAVPDPARTFFTAAERACVRAISARLIPSDDTGPGADEADVVTFIDRQLAGFFGRGERWYMKGPFSKGTDEQGYQSESPPAGLYRKALAALDAHCRGSHDGKAFDELDAGVQDDILAAMEDGELEFEGVAAPAFFALVLENTIEGFFSDPIYGGNRDMAGWRLVGFPGARYDYRDYLDHDGKRLDIPPVGLAGRSEWKTP
ncbi:gluconate 2-dehydrogenase subunit 3 family protein [Shinella sp. PSBB067]|uniref:gluconate 2-dehydrogenase subunit 3 family protein n=1 Tax=Shinella sp. PSBB067 TaxID=2715959 RepID=UPI00193BC2AD|nr:gluconate 2-dehydrogenase subunit 3 family protein [Shinella sp. PSBB067]QRI66053.1 gluconate 2-dehydrogenase subunit 3 family protein [Shinella sp. PSBB067]